LYQACVVSRFVAFFKVLDLSAWEFRTFATILKPFVFYTIFDITFAAMLGFARAAFQTAGAHFL
jgi:hypothetical protein